MTYAYYGVLRCVCIEARARWPRLGPAPDLDRGPGFALPTNFGTVFVRKVIGHVGRRRLEPTKASNS